MSFNRQKFMTVLSKWPIILPTKEYDYGYRLRELLRNKGQMEEIFSGTTADNSRKIDALMRLVHNSAKNEFLSSLTKGACGLHQKELKSTLEEHFNLEESQKTKRFSLIRWK